MPRVFTRREFHELVWSKPTVQLAKEFGMSDVALGKICRKHDIPKPPLGWWAKRHAGRKVTMSPLPRAKKGTSDSIVIVALEIRVEPDPLVAARQAAKIFTSALPDGGDEARHPVVARTVARLRKEAPARSGLVTTNDPALITTSIAPASIDRFALAMDRLVAALTAVGACMIKGGSAAAIGCDGESIGFSVREALRREKHVPTAEEGAQEKDLRRRLNKLPNRWNAEFGGAVPLFGRPEWDYHPTGEMSLALDVANLQNGPRRMFNDAKNQRIETLASDIAVGVAVAAAAMKLDRARREDEAKHREQERRRREQVLRTRHIEERQGVALDSVLEELAGLGRLRGLVESLRSQRSAGVDGRIAAFVDVAVRRLAEQEAALSPEGLSRRFAEQRLFGDDDDHGFRPPHV